MKRLEKECDLTNIRRTVCMCILEQQCDIVLNKKRELREMCVKVRMVNLGRLKKTLFLIIINEIA